MREKLRDDLSKMKVLHRISPLHEVLQSVYQVGGPGRAQHQPGPRPEATLRAQNPGPQGSPLAAPP